MAFFAPLFEFYDLTSLNFTLLSPYILSLYCMSMKVSKTCDPALLEDFFVMVCPVFIGLKTEK